MYVYMIMELYLLQTQHVKMNYKIIFGIILIVILTSFASAGLFDWLKNDEGKLKNLGDTKLKELIDDKWTKTITKIKKWKENPLNMKIEEDKTKELDISNSAIVIKENKDGVKVVYNAG